jgi:hypothetical protein
MAVRWAVTGGTWSSTSTWNDGATLGIPSVGDDVWTNGFTVNMDTNTTVNSLNNTARSRDIATPVMTSDVTPSGVGSIIYSSSNASFTAASAFNQDYGVGGFTGWQSLTANSGWLGYIFNSPRIIQAYAIFANNTQARTLRSWTFEGSNDGINWTVIESVTNNPITASGVYRSTNVNTSIYSYYRVNITATHTTGEVPNILELELYGLYTTIISAGGSFNFNTAGVTVSATSISINGINSFQITHPSGTVTINVSNDYYITIPGSGYNPLISYTGNGNLILSIPNIGMNVNNSNQPFTFINKTSTGDFTFNGNIFFFIVGQSSSSLRRMFNNTGGGNTVINGNVYGSQGDSSPTLLQSTGTLTINGNSIAPTLANGVSYGFANVIFTSNGNFIGGSSPILGISSTGIFTINGNVIADSVSPIIPTGAISITINGNVSASTTANAISLTNAASQVYLNGNMFNVNGKMAIYAPIVWLDQTGTTQSRFFTSGGADRTLYSDNTFPNLPSTSNVRQGVGFSPSSGLTGTIIIPSNTDVRSGVIYDNGTVGTALFDTSQLLAELNASSDPIAQRLRKVATPEILGQLLAAYKK